MRFDKVEKKAEITLEYQDRLAKPPVNPHQLHHQACSNDGITVDSWRDTWKSNMLANLKKEGDFCKRGIGQLYNNFKNMPCIVAGAGPSLARNAMYLKDRGDKMGLISCLHNFHYFEDLDANVDFYVTLDAGDITISEVSEGGKKSEQEYWDMTKTKTLIAYVGSPPELIERWQGDVYWFNCAIPDQEFTVWLDQNIKFNTWVGTGGNVLGACVYIAKAIMGANPIVYIGADFAFGYSRSFYPWSTKWDSNLGEAMRFTDIYGNKVWTWGSYYNFRSWAEKTAHIVPGQWINATEGGILGAHAQGNSPVFDYMDLTDVIEAYTLNDMIAPQCADPKAENKLLLF